MPTDERNAVRLCAMQGPQAPPELPAGWDELVERLSAGIDGPDLTSGQAWTLALLASRSKAIDASLLTVTSGERLVTLAPLHVTRGTLRKVPCRCLELVNELYAGRSSLLVDPPDPESLAVFFERLRHTLAPWDAFIFSLVEGSRAMHSLEALVARGDIHAIELERHQTPYIVFPDSYEEYFASLSRKFRWRVRNSVKRLGAQGSVSYREFRSADELDTYFAHMLEVERASWKEDEGSSISTNAHQERFYKEFLHAMAGQGCLSAHMLYLDDRPIAHLTGVIDHGIFYDLKESYHGGLRQLSPGHALKHHAFPSLVAQGVSLYDFRGKCESFKLDWTDKIYTRRRYALLGPTLRARAILAANRTMRALHGPPETTAPSQ